MEATEQGDAAKAAHEPAPPWPRHGVFGTARDSPGGPADESRTAGGNGVRTGWRRTGQKWLLKSTSGILQAPVAGSYKWRNAVSVFWGCSGAFFVRNAVRDACTATPR